MTLLRPDMAHCYRLLMMLHLLPHTQHYSPQFNPRVVDQSFIVYLPRKDRDVVLIFHTVFAHSSFGVWPSCVWISIQCTASHFPLCVPFCLPDTCKGNVRYIPRRHSAGEVGTLAVGLSVVISLVSTEKLFGAAYNPRTLAPIDECCGGATRFAVPEISTS